MKLPDHAFTDFAGIKRNFDALVKSVNALDTRIDSLENAVHARVNNSTSITVANVTAVTLTYDTEVFDVGGLHSTSSNTGRLTAPVLGLYYADINIGWSVNTAGLRELLICRNGNVSDRIAEVIDHPSSPSGHVRQHAACIIRLDVNEYLEAVVYQESGSTLTVAAAGILPTFSMVRLTA